MNANSQDWEQLFRPFSKIELAYLFGSRVEEQTHPDSDIDIALVVKKALTAQEEARLAASISKFTEVNKVDIAILNRAPSLLKYEAVANGRLMYQAVDDDQVNRFEMGVYREYFDTEPIRKLQYQYLCEEKG